MRSRARASPTEPLGHEHQVRNDGDCRRIASGARAQKRHVASILTRGEHQVEIALHTSKGRIARHKAGADIGKKRFAFRLRPQLRPRDLPDGTSQFRGIIKIHRINGPN